MTEVTATILRHLVIARIGLLCVIKEKKLASEYCLSHEKKKVTVNVIKFQTLGSFYSQTKCWLSGLEFTKCLSE